MPVNGFNVGKDCVLDLNVNGLQIFSLITGFSSKPDIVDTKVKGLDGLVRNVVFHDGWSGKFDLERQNSNLDDFWAQLEANYFAGLNTPAGTITETITEVSGQVSQYQYTGVIVKLDDAGDWRGDATVKQSLSFMASRRLKLQ